jgi:hypothetical protein
MHQITLILLIINLLLTFCLYRKKPELDVSCFKQRKKAYWSSLTISEGNIIITQIKGKLKIMALSLTDTQKADGVLSFLDVHGHQTDAATVGLASSDTSVFTTSYDDPSNTVSVVAVGPGVAALTITAKDSKGNILPFDDVAIEVTAGDAVSGTIAFGPPTEQ